MCLGNDSLIRSVVGVLIMDQLVYIFRGEFFTICRNWVTLDGTVPECHQGPRG